MKIKLLTVFKNILGWYFCFSAIILAMPQDLEQTAFLKSMLHNQSSNSKGTFDQEGYLDQETKVTGKKRVPAVLCKLIGAICQCGGRRLWNYMLPKHIRKAKIIRFIDFVDLLSFSIGSLMIYIGTYALVLKKEMFLMYGSLVMSSLKTFINENKPPQDPINYSYDEDQSVEDPNADPNEGRGDVQAQEQPVQAKNYFWVPPSFVQ